MADIISREELSIIDLVSEGPIEGPVDKNGTVLQTRDNFKPKDLYESIYINDVPVKNFQEDVYNFRYVKSHFRLGSDKQGPITNDEKFNKQSSSTNLNANLIGPLGKTTQSIAEAEKNGAIPTSFSIDNPEVSEVIITMLIQLADMSGQSPKKASIHLGIQWAAEGGETIHPTSIETVSVSQSAAFADKNTYGSSAADAPEISEIVQIISAGETSDKIEFTNGAIRVEGLCSSGATISFKVKLNTKDANGNIVDYLLSNPDRTNRILKIYKLSGEGDETDKVRNQKIAQVKIITENVPINLSFPYSAYVATTIDSRGFSSEPTRSFDMKLLKVKIPKNYTPWNENTQVGNNLYSGTWDGTFKSEAEWTSNPAWVFYDLLTNPVHGLGKFGLEKFHIDKWGLYEIAKYCDAVDSDGDFEGVDVGGVPDYGPDIKTKEPRFTCNTIIAEKQEAFELLYNLASAFNGMVYWGFGGIHAFSDKPRDPIMFFTSSDISSDGFNYSDSQKTTRITTVKTRYNDSQDNFKSKIEYVEDADAIQKFGIIEQDLVAFACTSRGQAQRLAKWVLYTSQRQKEMISFTTGSRGLYLRPGDVFRVFDELDNNKKIGGRILHVDQSDGKIKVDFPLIDSPRLAKIQVLKGKKDLPPEDIESSSDFEESRPTLIEEYTITNIDDDFQTLTIIDSDGNLPNLTSLDIGFPWLIIDQETYPQEEIKLYKVVNLKLETDGRISISGIEYNEEKYENIDSNKNLTEAEFDSSELELFFKDRIADPEIRTQNARGEQVNIPTATFKGIMLKSSWYIVPEADAYEVRYYKNDIIMQELTTRLLPTTENIRTETIDGVEKKYIQHRSKFIPKTMATATYLFKVSAIKNGKYSDAVNESGPQVK